MSRFGSAAYRVDERLPGVDLPLLSVSQTLGVIRRSELTDKPARAETLDVYKVCRKGDIVFNKMSIRAGAMGVSKEDGLVTYHYEVMRLRPGFDARYVTYLMKSDYFTSEMIKRERGIGSGDQVGVRTTEVPFRILRTIDVRLPSHREQVAIADFLDRETAKIDALIAKQAALVAGLRERRSAMVNHAMAVASGIAGMPLRQVCEIQTGITLGKAYGGSDVEELPYLRVANVQVGWIDLSDVATISLSPADAAQAILRPGDVLITEGGDRSALGRGSIWGGEIKRCLHQNHIFALRPRGQRLLPHYLVYVLEAEGARRYFESTRRQTTNLSSTNSRLVRGFRMTLPSIDEQQRIVLELDEVIGRISRASAKLEIAIQVAKERRSAVITAAVTGQLNIGKAA